MLFLEFTTFLQKTLLLLNLLIFMKISYFLGNYGNKYKMCDFHYQFQAPALLWWTYRLLLFIYNLIRCIYNIVIYIIYRRAFVSLSVVFTRTVHICQRGIEALFLLSDSLYCSLGVLLHEPE
jgi:hypothetical protein